MTIWVSILGTSSSGGAGRSSQTKPQGVQGRHLGAQELAVLATGGRDRLHRRLDECLDPAVVPQAVAVDEDLARLRAVLLVDHHRRVQGVDQVRERLGFWVHHALLAPGRREGDGDVLPLLGDEPLVPDEVGFQVETEGQGQLACLVGGELLGTEGVPRHEIPVGHGVELDRSTEQEPLLSQVDDFTPGKVEGFAGLERDGVAGLGVGVAGQDGPAFRDDREDRAERADVEIDAPDALFLESLSRLTGCFLHLALEIVPPGGLTRGFPLPADEEDRAGGGVLVGLVGTVFALRMNRPRGVDSEPCFDQCSAQRVPGSDLTVREHHCEDTTVR